MKDSLAWAIVAATVIIPRIQLFPVAGSFIRLEDLLFLINIIWLIVNRHKLDILPKYLIDIIKVLLAMSFIGITSSLFAVVASRNTFLNGILFSLRPLEYATLAPTIFILLKHSLRHLETVLLVLTLTTVISSILQIFFALQIGTSRFGFSRSSALTGGPYELAMISILLFIYWFKSQRLLLGFFCLVSLIASASRISVFALSIAFVILTFGRVMRSLPNDKLVHVKKKKSFKSIYIIIVLLVFAISSSLSVGLNQIFDKYERRLINTESNSLTIRESYTLSKSIPYIKDVTQYEEYVYFSPPEFTGRFESSDASTRRRYFVWFVLLNTFVNTKTFILGLGPGFGGSAVDGNYVRILAETGILGVIIYWKWFSVFLKRSTYWFKAAIASVLVTGFYIDIFTSIKTSLLLYIYFLISNSEKTSSITQTNTD